MFKKGELTTQQIVILIILVASFAVILFFIFKLNLGKQTDQDICHNSVITRGKSILPTDSFPLQCKRQYVCLSADGTCEKMTKPEIIKVKTQDDVYKALADQLSQCWWMFGEGKINYVGSDTFRELYCSICSQISFDNSVKTVFSNKTDFAESNLYNYMNTHVYQDSKTYSQYLYGTTTFVKPSSSSYKKINLDNQYYSLMGIKSSVSRWTWAGSLALAALVGSATGGAGFLLGGIVVASAGTGGYFLAPVVQGQVGNEFISPSLIEVNSQDFNDLKCQEISTSS